MDDTSSGAITFSSPLTLTLIIGFPLLSMILYGRSLMSFCTVESLNR
eukprot:CAMPEP_0179070300 /NCGR_PEP_ID=MMETSP0796-20121207/30948_1 /TAXON_ID=73915 /ORGANISM="Pyrodinium bahamense, Strain pbaha01" /LENGTH=46 /DNA_ID= /DNA_START= /DNA_END= /DNA_ORIENTATION=